MTSRLSRQPSSVQQDSFPDDATDSGYGGSVINASSTDSENLFEKSFANGSRNRVHMASERHQELYQENCRLLTGSIEDTKHILKVMNSLYIVFLLLL